MSCFRTPARISLMILQPGDSEKLRLEVAKKNDAAHTRLYLTIVTEGQISRHETTVLMPAQSDWQLFLAQVRGEAVAGAVLTYHGKLAYLADAATAPEGRGLGAQTALLRTRLAKAREFGCDRVFSRAQASSGLVM